MYYKCCVDNCASKRQDVKMHQFPATETGLQMWLQCINSDRLRSLSIQELRKMFVCHKHFERRFITEKSRIRLGAYPTLFTEEEINNGLPNVTHPADIIRYMTFDHCYEKSLLHADHSYTKVGPASNVTTLDPSPDQPPVPQQLPSTSGPSLEQPPVPQQLPSTSDPLPEQPPVPEQLPSTSGPSLEQPPVPQQLPSTSDPLPEQPPVPEQLPSTSDPLPEQPPVPEQLPSTSDPSPEQPPVPQQLPSTSGSSLEQPPVPQQLPSTSGLTLKRSRVLREIQNLPQAADMSDAPPEQPPVLENIQKESRQPSESGVTADASSRKKKRRRRMMRKLADLSPCCRDIYFEYKKSVKQLDFMRRAKRAIKFSKTEAFEKLTSNVNPLAKQIMWMQISQSSKKLKGRRFTDEQKMISLAILKQSPKAYRFLQKIFILPSRNTLMKMSSTLNVQPGINTQIFDAIKDEVQHWNEKRKYCSIVFDEIKLTPAVEPDKTKDHINGFVHLNEKKNDYADHALAFMLTGAICKWQQPVAFYFCAGTTSKDVLQVILKDIINAVIDTGLLPVAVICDQGQTFQSALKALTEDTRRDQIKAGKPIDDVITIRGHDVSVFFDPPHLIKGIRNNLLTKDLKFDDKVCKWSDIVDVYNTDCGHAQTRLLHKLNDTHVIPEKIKKMKVKNCTRVLSQTVASALSYTSQFSHYADGRKVSETLKNTAEAVEFFDKLFDSVNGASLSEKNAKAKPLKKAVTHTSPHHDFWKDAIRKLEKMKFIDAKRGEVSVYSIKNWITTLKSYIRLWQWFEKKNIKIMRPRYFNSDPIENFFGQVRAYNFRNNDPTCHTFISTFKSLLITRFIKFHSTGFNCEEDVGVQLLNIKKLFQRSDNEAPDANIAPPNDANESREEQEQLLNIQAQARRERISVHSRAYTAGWLVRKINKKINCRDCLADLTTEEGPIHSWISQREYNWLKNKSLTYPSEYAVRTFTDIVKESNKYLNRKPHLNSISAKIKDYFLSKYSFDYLKCELHKNIVIQYFVSLTIRFAVFNWCNVINKILNGTDTSRLGKSGLPLMQAKALQKYEKTLKNKKK